VVPPKSDVAAGKYDVDPPKSDMACHVSKGLAVFHCSIRRQWHQRDVPCDIYYVFADIFDDIAVFPKMSVLTFAMSSETLRLTNLMSQMSAYIIWGCQFKCQSGCPVCHHEDVCGVVSGVSEDMGDVSDKYLWRSQ